MVQACSENLIAKLHDMALALGFTRPAITSASEPWQAGLRLHEFIAKGYHGQMDWMAKHAHRREHPNQMWPEAQTAIVLGFNYGPDHDPMLNLQHKNHGNISVYARAHDYHDIIKKKLKKLAGFVGKETGKAVKVFVDTAPLMEKPLAAKAGLGWQGKHTNLVSREFGSWLFIGVILAEAKLAADHPQKDLCGSCRACLDICPTNAFIAPYQLEATACISYLTIEHKGHIPAKYRKSMGNRIYGCDDCLAICPWNKYAKLAHETKLHARPELNLPLLADLAALDELAFRQVFTASPIKRIGRDRFVRNVMIAIGNSRNTALIKTLELALVDDSALVRAMAVWALGQLASPKQFQQARDNLLANETDPNVRMEWQTHPCNR